MGLDGIFEQGTQTFALGSIDGVGLANFESKIPPPWNREHYIRLQITYWML